MTAGADLAVGTPWRRLHPRMLVVGPLAGLVRLVPFVAILLITGRGDLTRLWIALAAAGVVVVASVLRWRSTRYRITEDRVELHTGVFQRQRRSVPRDRIRTVDLTAKVLHRLFGLSVVRVGTASGDPAGDVAGLDLDAVGTGEADRLRRELLHHSPVAAAPAAAAVPPAEELARLDWGWLRYAPLTLSSLAGIGAVGAALFNLFDDLGVDPRDVGALGAAADRLAAVPVWAGVAAAGTALLVAAAAGSVALFAERWWGYRLTREPDGTLRLRRGLLTRRSLSIAEQRLRGAEVLEPLLLRAGRGAQCRALTTGLSAGDGAGMLVPPAPRAEAHRVAAAVLREHPLQITGAAVRRHPPAARTRRLVRAVGPAAVLVAAAWAVGVAGGVGWLGPVALVLLPAAALLGLDRYRHLGHELTARHLVTRVGGLRRRSVALQRDGVIGWTIRQSPFQRRRGLVTLTATTAAGERGYDVLDMAAADAVALADAATPGLLGRLRAAPDGTSAR